MRTRGSLFTALLTLAAGALLLQTLDLTAGSRLAPLWVVLPTFALLMLQLVLDADSYLSTRLVALREGSLSGAWELLDYASPPPHAHDDEPVTRRRRGLRMMMWGAFLLALVYVLGFLGAVPFYLAPYLRTEVRVSWKKALIVTAFATGVLYLVFGLLLKAPLPRGLIG